MENFEYTFIIWHQRHLVVVSCPTRCSLYLPLALLNRLHVTWAKCKKNVEFWAKNAVFLAQNPFFFGNCPTFLLLSWADTKKTTFLCWLRCTAVHKKMVSGQEQHFWAPKGPLWAIGATKRPAKRPNGRFRKKTWPTHQKVFTHSAVRALPASNSPKCSQGAGPSHGLD